MKRLSNFFISFCVLICSSCNAINQPTKPEILPGAYQTENYIHDLIGKNVALVANHTAIINDKHVLDTLLKLNVNITKAFAPEHGFWGKEDAGAEVADDKVGGNIEIISIYGKNKKPKDEDLKDVDVLVFDIQDVGTRFFTYISTLHYVMEACAENNVEMIILDRPNPNGHYVDGPLMEEKFKSFVGMHSVPVVYGLTIGEYGTMINEEGWLEDSIKCKLKVIACKNYTHDTPYTLPVSPSPNLPDMESVYLYPSTCLFEGTVMSEGRGTTTPFRLTGHPKYPDTTFSFTPKAIKGASMYPKFKNEKCYGVSYLDIKADSLWQMGEIWLKPVLDAYRSMQMGDDFFINYFENLIGASTLRAQIKEGWSEEEIKRSWEKDLKKYMRTRAKYLL
ncbi:MAG: DUF1343 domain-containing protein, partial [Bacteroidales bacterium]|nr:DUF1343 domain-containing protein [Bacteroidales bacterium]